MDTGYIAEQVAMLMPKIGRRILLEFFQSVDIPQTQLLTIMALYESKECSFSELSQRMAITPPTATGLVDRLEKSGYAKRVPSATDRRVIHIELTDKGVKIAKQFRSSVKKRWKTVLDKMPQKDAEAFLKTTQKIEELL